MNLRKVSNELLKYFGRSADNALLPKMLRIASEASYAVIVSSGDDDDDDGVLRFIGENEVKIPLLRKTLSILKSAVSHNLMASFKENMNLQVLSRQVVFRNELATLATQQLQDYLTDKFNSFSREENLDHLIEFFNYLKKV